MNRFVDLRIPRPNEKAVLLWWEEQMSHLCHMSRLNAPPDRKPKSSTLVQLHVPSWRGSWRENGGFNFALVTFLVLTSFTTRNQGVQLCSIYLSRSDRVPNKKLGSPTFAPVTSSSWHSSWQEITESNFCSHHILVLTPFLTRNQGDHFYSRYMSRSDGTPDKKPRSSTFAPVTS